MRPLSSWIRNALSGTLLPPEPHNETLCIEVRLVLQERIDLFISEQHTVPAREDAPQLLHLLRDHAFRIGPIRVSTRDLHELAHLRLELVRELRDLCDAAVMHQVDRFRPVRADAIDGRDEL